MYTFAIKIILCKSCSKSHILQHNMHVYRCQQALSILLRANIHTSIKSILAYVGAQCLMLTASTYSTSTLSKGYLICPYLHVLCVHTWMEYPSTMECAYNMHGIPQYHAWNAPIPHMEYALSRMEYACTMNGICLYHAWNTLVPRMEYTWKMQISCMT